MEFALTPNTAPAVIFCRLKGRCGEQCESGPECVACQAWLATSSSSRTGPLLPETKAKHLVLESLLGSHASSAGSEHGGRGFCPQWCMWWEDTLRDLIEKQ